MKHNEDGRRAEEKAAAYLEKSGYTIIERNWKTPRCEIDIIAQKEETIFFVEVKYRSSANYGEGFDYITSAKQRQMAFAAEVWVSSNTWAGEYVLAGASVSGPDFDVQFIEEI